MRSTAQVRRCLEFSAGARRTRSVTRAAPACPRQALAAAVDAGPDSYAAQSRMLGRRPGYLACFVRERHPTALSEADHQALADYFGLLPRGLGVRELWVPMEDAA